MLSIQIFIQILFFSQRGPGFFSPGPAFKDRLQLDELRWA
jgi:hypothetical protein